MIRFQNQPMADRVMAKILTVSRYINERKPPEGGAGPDVTPKEPPVNEPPPLPPPIPEPPPQAPPQDTQPDLPPVGQSGLDIAGIANGDSPLIGLLRGNQNGAG